MNPENDKTGAGWHALQAQTAIGNGQLFGEGFMQGTQNQFQFLPVRPRDDFRPPVFGKQGEFCSQVEFRRHVSTSVGAISKAAAHHQMMTLPGEG